MLQLKNKKNIRAITLCLCALLGAIFFIAIYGTATLDVTNDIWIYEGYDENDITQHYQGWLAFRQAEWTFPILYTDQLGYPGGTYLSYMDVNPIFAVFFKILNPLLPQTFQFFGIFVFMCFILQGLASGMLLWRIKQSSVFTLIGSMFFISAPIILERAFRHTTLTAHFYVLFAIYFYFTVRDKVRSGEKPKLPWQMWVLNITSVGVSPYWLAMTMMFTLLSLIEIAKASGKKSYLKCAIIFFANGIGAMILAFVLGTIGGESSFERAGFGNYSMNLNAFYNPTSLGGYEWSYFLSTHNQVGGNYDGFNYLGVGVLLMLFTVVVFCFNHLSKIENAKTVIIAFLKKYAWLIAACVFLTMFALSNVIKFNSVTLLTIPLPEFILDLCNIYRASSRMFYPVYYILILCGIYGINKYFKGRAANIIIAFFLIVQIADISGALLQKNNMMRSANDETVPVTAGTNQGGMRLRMDHFNEIYEVLEGKGETHSTLVFEWVIPEQFYRDALIFSALQEEMNTTVVNANSGDYTATEDFIEETFTDLENGIYDKDTIYVTYLSENFEKWHEALKDEDVEFVLTECGAYFVIPN